MRPVLSLCLLLPSCHIISQDAISWGVFTQAPESIVGPDVTTVCSAEASQDPVPTRTAAPWLADGNARFVDHAGHGFAVRTDLSSYVIALDGTTVDLGQPGLLQLSPDCSARRYAYTVEVDGADETLRFTSNSLINGVSNRTEDGWSVVVDDVYAPILLAEDGSATLMERIPSDTTPQLHAVSDDSKSVLFFETRDWSSGGTTSYRDYVYFRWDRGTEQRVELGEVDTFYTSSGYTQAGLGGASANLQATAVNTFEFFPTNSSNRADLFSGSSHDTFSGSVPHPGFSADGAWMLLKTGATIVIVETETGARATVHAYADEPFSSVTVSGDGRYIALLTDELVLLPNPLLSR